MSKFRKRRVMEIQLKDGSYEVSKECTITVSHGKLSGVSIAYGTTENKMQLTREAVDAAIQRAWDRLDVVLGLDKILKAGM